MPKADATEQRAELLAQRRRVDFDTYDITVDDLIRRVARRRIEIAPAYQRQFRWDASRQSRLVESVMLGIPVPPLFMATNIEADEGRRWEVVDGLQRLLSLTNFLGDEETRTAARLEGKPLRLTGLESLEHFEGLGSDDLPADIRDGLLDRPMKVVVLNDKSELKVRFDLFERLNTGGVRLTDQEIRESVYAGEFVDALTAFTFEPDFKSTVRLPESRQKDGTPQDYALRFFAFHERYKIFEHSVRDFLNDFMADAAKEPRLEARARTFRSTFNFLSRALPNGLKGRKGTTPVNLFEGVAVGAALALERNPRLEVPDDLSWVAGDELRAHISGGTNNRLRVAGRIEYCRDMFLTA